MCRKRDGLANWKDIFIGLEIAGTTLIRIVFLWFSSHSEGMRDFVRLDRRRASLVRVSIRQFENLLRGMKDVTLKYSFQGG